MDLHPNPFSGKTQQKPKTNPKMAQSTKPNSKDPPIQRQKRVFGTIRNSDNILKPTIEKTVAKPSISVAKKQPKQSREMPKGEEVASNSATTAEKPRSKLVKKSVCFQEQVGPTKVSSSSSPEGNAGPRTPVASPSFRKPKISGTPYRTAENCSKCRFDKLETASYWVAQIKLGELVGKHFISLAFFRLALESKAEPTRNLRLELKRYLQRHSHLSAEAEWREVCLSYGIQKDESNSRAVDSSNGKSTATQATTSVDFFQEHKGLNEETKAEETQIEECV